MQPTQGGAAASAAAAAAGAKAGAAGKLAAAACDTAASGDWRLPSTSAANVDDDGVLVPVLDFFNHDHFSCHIDLVCKSGDAPPGISAVVRPGSSVERGEEVLFSYGAKPNSCLLLSYGFVQFDNVHDVCYLHLPAFLGLSHVSEGGSPRTIEDAAVMSARLTLAQELVEDGRHT